MKGAGIAIELTARLQRKQRWDAALWDLLAYTPSFLTPSIPLVHVFGDHAIRFRVCPEYWCLGEDDDYLVLPMTPTLATRIASSRGWQLPTPRLVNLIYRLGSAVPSYPQPANRQSLSTFLRINAQCDGYIRAHQPRPALLVGHRKDIVVCAELAAKPKAVAIYGWHGLSGKPIQPLFCGHSANYYDYSHGVRYLDEWCELDGQRVRLSEVYAKKEWWPLVSKNGPVKTYS